MAQRQPHETLKRNWTLVADDPDYFLFQSCQASPSGLSARTARTPLLLPFLIFDPVHKGICVKRKKYNPNVKR
jgi:hypothetical protein